MKRFFLPLAAGIFLSGCSPKMSPSGRTNDSAVLAKQERKAGYTTLFDGRSLSGWIDNNHQYEVADGAIVKKTKGYGNLYTEAEYRNFVLRFEFLLTPGANNGLGVRHKLVNGAKGYDGVELQILDNSAPIYKDLKPYQYHGSLYSYVPAKRRGLKPVGQWNYQEVAVDGYKIRITLNGEIILDTDVKNLPAAALAKDPRLLYEKGHIAFLGHDSEIRLRNIRIRELK
ncbi:3-keto-disaccharide hydrolase [Niabella hirudinis]|uniref:3-keto-disaccharide hydrolase n=1 Tax=Niabella hirudinis TaxID=1285929 RepID=UPI003EBB2D32